MIEGKGVSGSLHCGDEGFFDLSSIGDCALREGNYLQRGDLGGAHNMQWIAAYLSEMEFRFNDRSNPSLFCDTLVKLIEAPALEYRKLTAA